jgi:hypothetical protein
MIFNSFSDIDLPMRKDDLLGRLISGQSIFLI